MKAIVNILLLSLLAAVSSAAEDLYKVTLYSNRDAITLQSVETDVIMSLPDGYLVLADDGRSEALRRSGLDIELLASGVRRDQLVIDGRFDRKNAEQFEVLYESGELRLLLANHDRLALAEEPVEVFPLPDRDLKVLYRKPSNQPLPELTLAALEDIQTLIDRVEQDSLEAYVLRLEAFYTRRVCTDSNYAARDYIAHKFTEFGYDSMYLDRFEVVANSPATECFAYNVVACKVGSVFPDQQVIIGGHFDGVSNSPAADDNASGTAAVLELARVIQDVDTRLTFIFIAFDAEEPGLWGSYHYVDGVIERNDDVVLMVNADMIGHWENSDEADLYTGPEVAYAQLWDELGNNYVGIDAFLSVTWASDHAPFQEAGYDVVYVQERLTSTVYHQPSDSSTYLDFEYMTRMVQATLAAVYTTDLYPPPVRITSVIDPGDGQSLAVSWQDLNPDAISYYRLSYYPVSSPLDVTAVDMPPTQTELTVEGLTEGNEYAFYVQAFDALDQTSLAFDCAYGTPVSVPEIPGSFALSQNYPNPFNPFTRVDYSLARAARVRIEIYNILGHKVATLVDGFRPAGNYTVEWYGNNDAGEPVASGLYFYRMISGGTTESKKMLLIK